MSESTRTDAVNLCPDCAGPGFFRYDALPGDPNFGRLVACQNPVHSPDRLRRLAKLSNLSEADLQRRLSDIKPVKGNEEMLAAAQAMATESYGWLYVWGGPGNAKSEVLIAIVNEINTYGRGPAMYVTFSHLLNWVRDAFKDNAPDSYLMRFQQVLGVKLLAIDEMDKARSTEFSDEFRFHFLDERYRQAIRGETQIVFASNTNPDKLPFAIYDRIRDGRFRIVENKAGSARPNMRRK